MSTFSCDIKQLADLLKTENETSDTDDDLPAPGLSKLGPGHIGTKVPAATNSCKVTVRFTAGGDALENKVKSEVVDNDAIWSLDEVKEPVDDDHFDPREIPEYDIKYQQAVSPEDVYLQMSGKTGATASCENMVVTVQLQGESKKAIDLTVTTTTLEIRSPLYRLQLHLPHNVDPDKGHAKWNETEHTLSVVMRMVREYDFVNF